MEQIMPKIVVTFQIDANWKKGYNLAAPDAKRELLRVGMPLKIRVEQAPRSVVAHDADSHSALKLTSSVSS